MEKLPEIKKAKKIGKNLNVTIGDENYTLVVDKEEGQSLAEEIEAYKSKPTKARYNALIKKLTPKTTEQKEVKEKAIVQTKGEIAKEKKVIKETPKVKKPAITKKASSAKKSLIEDVRSAVKNKDLTDAERAELRGILANELGDKKDVPAPTPKPSTSYRRGEH